MEESLTQDQVKEKLAGKKIVDVDFNPYMSIKLDDNSTIKILPEQLKMDDCIYLNLTYTRETIS